VKVRSMMRGTLPFCIITMAGCIQLTRMQYVNGCVYPIDRIKAESAKVGQLYCPIRPINMVL
jgi:hypothetical protein